MLKLLKTTKKLTKTNKTTKNYYTKISQTCCQVQKNHKSAQQWARLNHKQVGYWLDPVKKITKKVRSCPSPAGLSSQTIRFYTVPFPKYTESLKVPQYEYKKVSSISSQKKVFFQEFRDSYSHFKTFPSIPIQSMSCQTIFRW